VNIQVGNDGATIRGLIAHRDGLSGVGEVSGAGDLKRGLGSLRCSFL